MTNELDLSKIKSRVLEVRRGLYDWEVKPAEANESRWRSTGVPLTVPEPQAVDLITRVFMGRNPMTETVTIMVRNDPDVGIGRDPPNPS